MVEKINCQFVSWENVAEWSERLSKKVVESSYKPDTIIALARSGFIPGRLISDFLGISDLVCLKVEHWLDTTAEHKENATIPYKIPFKLEGKRVLVVDDIVDTGKSMEESVKYIKTFKPRDVRTAVMQYFDTSIHKPNYYSELISGKNWAWFVYPWNVIEDLGNLIAKILKDGACDESKVRKVLWESFNLEVSKEKVVEVLDEMVERKRYKREGKNYSLI